MPDTSPVTAPSSGAVKFIVGGDVHDVQHQRRLSNAALKPSSPPTQKMGHAAGDNSLISPKKSSRPRRWQLNYILRILPRRYLLQRCALEFFFVDNSSVFVAFSTIRLRSVWEAILSQRPVRLCDSVKSLKPSDHFRSWGVQERWRKRQIGNFEYLMYLNIAAGRRFDE